MNGIIITTNLPGRIGGSVRHTSTQTVSILVSKIGSSKPVWISREILHTDRPRQVCYRKTNISEEVVNYWISDDVPEWGNKKEWSKMSPKQRLISYVSRFDEGFGVTYEEL